MKFNIPSTWRDYKIKNIARLGSGSTPARALDARYYTSDGIYWVKTTDLNNGNIYVTEEQITNEALKESSCKIFPAGTVLVAMYGGFRQIGRTGLLKMPAAINQALTAILVDKSIAEPSFVLHWLNGNVVLWRSFAASSRKDPNITKDDIATFPIHLPPIGEQRKISGTIEQWDCAIDLTERLIAAKQERRTWLMQQLLTGKRRLPGFDGEWRNVHLGEVFTNRVESNLSDLPLVAITGNGGVVSRDDLVRRDTSSEDKSKYLRICPGDIGYNTMRMWQGVCGLSQLEGIVSPAYTIVTPKADIDGEFMALLFKSLPVIHLFHRHSQGLVNDTLNLKWRHFAEIKVTIPEKDEQQAIAAVFRTADRELDLLRAQLDSLREQKKGLMQQLLTGKIRVKVVS